MDNKLIPAKYVEIIKSSDVPSLMNRIRPSWKSKNLISRVERLLQVDPSSACQRILNASIHDLREKVVVAGVDIAKSAAAQNKLPPINSPEDLEQYPTAKLIDLAYKIGFLSRPEWRRVSRCYEIRRDLEHEDDEYEAGIEDCVYIFRTCIEVILSKDPIHLLKVTDVKEIVEKASPAVPTETLIDEFKNAPSPRQEEIFKFLLSISLDKTQSEIVQQNAFTFLEHLSPFSHNPVRLNLAKHFQDKIGRTTLDQRHARVAYTMGLLPYLKQSQVVDFFESIYSSLIKVGTSWQQFEKHGNILRSFIEVGSFQFCPTGPKEKILKFLVLTYLGKKGGLTRFGHVRHVFYSDTAAPLIEDIFNKDKKLIREDFKALKENSALREKRENLHLARRLESLIDLIEEEDI